MTEISNKTIAQLLDAIDNAEEELRKAKHIIRLIEEAKIQSYRELPGVEGIFDGNFMVADDGQKFEVPSNYSAKSRLVYGDRLKKVEDNGETLYKQIEKKPRKKVEGILNKKEGKWYIISDAGSYRVSDAAVEFNHAELNDEAIALIPEADLNVPFAALDKVLTQRQPQQFVPQPQHRPLPPQMSKQTNSIKPKEKINVINAVSPTKAPLPPRPLESPAKPKKRTAVPAAAPRRDVPIAPIRPQETHADDNAVSTLRDLGDDDLR